MALEKTKYDGLYYRLDKNGKKVYVARIYKDGKDTTKTLGKEPQLNLKVANKMRLDILEELSKGYSLKNLNKKNNELFKEYLALRKNSLSSTYIYATEKNYDKYLKSRIGEFHPKDVTTSQVQKIINEILESGKAPQTAKAIKIPKFDNSRVIELTDEQTKRLFESLFTYPDIKIRTIFIWLLHGRRKGEVLNVKWEDIDFEKNIYTIDSSISKIKKTLQFSLTDALITALKEYGIKSRGLVFGSNLNENKIISKTGMDYHWKNICFPILMNFSLFLKLDNYTKTKKYVFQLMSKNIKSIFVYKYEIN